MPSKSDLHRRIEELGKKIDAANEKIRLQHVLYQEHGPTGADLQKRYELLQKRLNEEVAEAEGHGHDVTALERSFRAWMDGLSFDN